MANYTPYLDLKKPLGSEYYNVADQNGNMDKIDTSIQGLGNGLGIIAKGNTHAAITSGEYVYVHGHGTLAEGLYKATANIAANGTLTSSNLAALPKGVGGDVAALNGKIVTKAYTSSDIGITGILKSWVKAGVAYLRFYDFRPTSESYTLGTLPTALRPIDLFNGILVNSADGSCAKIQIETNGNVSITGGKTSNLYYGTIVYLVE